METNYEETKLAIARTQETENRFDYGKAGFVPAYRHAGLQAGRPGEQRAERGNLPFDW